MPRFRLPLETLLLVLAAGALLLWLLLAPRAAMPDGSKSSLAPPSLSPGTATTAAPAEQPGLGTSQLRAELTAKYAAELQQAEGLGPKDPKADAKLGAYVSKLVQQLLPAAESCYAELLVRRPTAAGSLLLELSILGDAEKGSVALSCGLGQASTLKDPDLSICIQQRVLELAFPGLPNGLHVLTVTQSLDFGQ